MKRQKILIIGYFGYKTNKLDGQTIKTREIFNLIKDKSSNEINYFDTQAFRSRPYIIISLLKLVHKSDIIIYLPGQSNLKLIFPIIRLFIKRKAKLIYPVVGGWLDDFLRFNPRYIKYLKRFDLIGVETLRLKNNLENIYNLHNVYILTNFRRQKYTPYRNEPEDGLRVVFMARITESKGCNTLFEIAEKLRLENIRNIRFKFYGKIDPKYKSFFYKKLAENEDMCSYGGLIQPTDVCSTLNQHDVLILPTMYEGEGFPGSIVDAYKAGIPVIVSKWKDLPEFVVEGKTGFVIALDNVNEYLNKIIELTSDYNRLRKLKMCAYEESKKYSAENAWSIISQFL